MGEIIKSKRYAKPFHRLTQRQFKRVVIGHWTFSYRNTLQKSCVLFMNVLINKKRVLNKALPFFQMSRWTHFTSLSLAKFWITVPVVLTFNIFWPKLALSSTWKLSNEECKQTFSRAGEIFPTNQKIKAFIYL